MKLETLVVGPFTVNCYLLINDQNQALIFDPGDDADLICDTIRNANLSVAGYVLTHGHCDHICALYDVHSRYPAPVYMHPADAQWAFSPTNQLAPYYPPPQKPDTPIIDLTDQQILPFGTVTLTAIHTPGHSPGGLCLYVNEESILIAGDTLFKGSVGRTDLPGGNSRQLAASLKKLKTLPDETRIYPGHGEASTLTYEKKFNFFMQ